jgi:transcriptional regulator with XRE-family HTH domain
MPRLFGAKLRHLRQGQALTQSELADKLSLAAYTHISKLEGGQRVPSLHLVIRIAHLFRVSIDYLLRDTLPLYEIHSFDITSANASVLSVSKLGENLRALRIQHGLSQSDLATQVKIASRAYISNLEAGRKTPSLEILVQLAELFNIAIDEMLIQHN